MKLAHAVIHARSVATTHATPPRRHPLVVLHGLFGSKQNWTSLSKALARATGATVWSLDLRNHGESPHHPAMTYAAMADDVRGFLAAHHLTAPVVVGHSMGGKVAMRLALDSPDAVAGVMSLDMAPRAFNLSLVFPLYIAAMREVEAAEPAKLADADRLLQRYVPDTGVRQFLLTNLKRTADHKLRFRVPLDTLRGALPELGDFVPPAAVTPYVGPVALVGASKADYVHPRMLADIRRDYFPNATLDMMDAGHWLHAERPAEVINHIAAFLDRVKGTSSNRPTM
ncbi:hypothetical protein H9P43_009477 [Blastocladiella emersonii ATCC 22665]|nr:hypothetical protein H9P43_009477 [Blastocladiella emersonii ATCC 22665]